MVGKNASAWVTLRVVTIGDDLPSEVVVLGGATKFRWQGENLAKADYEKCYNAPLDEPFSSKGTRHVNLIIDDGSDDGSYLSYIIVPVIPNEVD